MSRRTQPPQPGAWGLWRLLEVFMLTFLIDTMGYLIGSSLLDSFFSCSAIAILIMVIRKIFERGA